MVNQNLFRVIKMRFMRSLGKTCLKLVKKNKKGYPQRLNWCLFNNFKQVHVVKLPLYFTFLMRTLHLVLFEWCLLYFDLNAISKKYVLSQYCDVQTKNLQTLHNLLKQSNVPPSIFHFSTTGVLNCKNWFSRKKVNVIFSLKIETSQKTCQFYQQGGNCTYPSCSGTNNQSLRVSRQPPWRHRSYTLNLRYKYPYFSLLSVY